MGLLRFLLALAVVATHFSGILGHVSVGGQIAVQSFFIVSGFYMSLILSEKYVGSNNSYRLFISNRFIRLFPIYWVVLIATILAFLGFSVITHGTARTTFDYYQSVTPSLSTWILLILTSVFIFGLDAILFLGIRHSDGSVFFTSNFRKTNPELTSYLFVPQAWTLGLELMFYLIAPFIIKRGYKLVIPLIIAALTIRLFLFYQLGFREDPWTYRFFPSELMFFLLGFISYRIYARIKKTEISRAFSWSVWSVVMCFTLFYDVLPEFRFISFPFSAKEIVYFSVLIFSIPILFKLLKRSKLDAQIGELSYPIYISHLLVGLICSGLANHINQLKLAEQGWAIAILTVGVSYLLNRFVSVPIERYRQGRLQRVPAPQVEAVL